MHNLHPLLLVANQPTVIAIWSCNHPYMHFPITAIYLMLARIGGMHHIQEFMEVHREAYLIPKRLNQEVVELFFSLQHKLCDGNRNKKSHSFPYNVDGTLE